MSAEFDLHKWANSGLKLDMRQEDYDYEAGVLNGRLEGVHKALELISDWAKQEQSIAEFKELNIIAGGIRVSQILEQINKLKSGGR